MKPNPKPGVPSCVMLMLVPAMLSVVLRAMPLVLFAIERLKVRLPDTAEVGKPVIQVGVLEASQLHPEFVVTVTFMFPPETLKLPLVDATANVHWLPAWLTKNRAF